MKKTLGMLTLMIFSMITSSNLQAQSRYSYKDCDNKKVVVVMNNDCDPTPRRRRDRYTSRCGTPAYNNDCTQPRRTPIYIANTPEVKCDARDELYNSRKKNCAPKQRYANRRYKKETYRAEAQCEVVTYQTCDEDNYYNDGRYPQRNRGYRNNYRRR